MRTLSLFIFCLCGVFMHGCQLWVDFDRDLIVDSGTEDGSNANQAVLEQTQSNDASTEED